ncbi:MAG: hypothetical protein IPI55_03350 [Flavobacteriales bacterium]|nr:hypothetical protein [Flavobacteriales bacterium]
MNKNPYSIARRALLSLLLIICLAPAMAQLGISRNPAFVPAADAMLDVSVASLAANAKMGILIPRMDHTARAAISAAPATGLIVYQTDDYVPPLPAQPQPKGYWYYDGTLWQHVSNGSGWSLYGDAATNPALDYAGTFDNQNFRLRTNSTAGIPPIGVTITAGATPGRVGVNTATTNEMMEVAGGILVNGGTPGSLPGNIRGVPGILPGTTVHQGYMGAPVNNWYQLENVFGERLNQRWQYLSGGCNYPRPASLPNPDISNAPAADYVTIGTGPISVGSTIESPYATGWEDHKVQYLYRATELNAVMANFTVPAVSAICPTPEAIEGLAFNVDFAATYPMQNVEIKMVNTTATNLTAFITGPMTTVHTAATYTAVNGWNVHAFSTPFAWNGTGNVIVEYCFNNNDWAGGTSVRFDNTAYTSLFGSFCDACGGLFAPGTCYFASCPNNTPQAGPGVLCTGYSHTPGCQHFTGMSLGTCDGTFQWQGQQGSDNRHPQIRFYCKVGSLVQTDSIADYMYTPHGVMVGTAAWASGVAPFAFQGPGTISAQNQVWVATYC